MFGERWELGTVAIIHRFNRIHRIMKGKFMKSILAISPMLILMIMVSGCGGSNQLNGLVTGEGKIIFNGQPLEGASISLTPVNTGSQARSAGALSEQGGVFKISTLDPNDGIYPGEYQVTVRKSILLGPEPTEAQIREASDTGVSLPERKSQSQIPLQYADVSKSDLKITIPEKGDKNIVINLEGTAP